MLDGFVKSPNSLLRCILRFFMVRYVQIITQDLRALNLELFSLPSEIDFLRVCHA
jgi:hypothetical protein